MEALSAGTELGSEVSAAINLAAEEHATIKLHCTKEGLLSATLVDLKEKCMQVLGTHLQRHSVPLDEPDLDVLDETFEDDEASKEELVEGAAPPKKKRKETRHEGDVSYVSIVHLKRYLHSNSRHSACSLAGDCRRRLLSPAAEDCDRLADRQGLASACHMGGAL